MVLNSSLIQPVFPLKFTAPYKPKSTKTILEVGKACFNGVCPIEEQVEQFDRSFKDKKGSFGDDSARKS